MTGAILNAIGILAGGIFGLMRPAPLSARTQMYCRALLGAGVVFFGLRMVWVSVNGPFVSILKQLFILMLALILGRLLGKMLHLQSMSNRVGQYAKRRMESHRPDDPHRFSHGLNVCAALFCAAPLGILGAVHDALPTEAGMDGHWQVLALKGFMDALAMMGFVVMFGPGAIVSLLPVFVFQGTITLACGNYAEPFLRAHGLVDAVNGTGGLLLCMVSVVIFEVRRVELADYLPALAVSPIITWLWR
jgi:uncharacterized protein